MSRYAVYYVSDADAAAGASREWDFVNQLRHDLGSTNVTLRGAGSVLSLYPSVLAAGNWSDPGTWSEEDAAKYEAPRRNRDTS